MFSFFKKKAKNEPGPVQTETASPDTSTYYAVVNSLGIRGYKAVHTDTIKTLQKQIPDCGPAASLQAELIRETDKLWDEASRNGNMNWDSNYEWFCDHIKRTLLETDIFDDAVSEKISGAIDYIKQCGQYAAKFEDYPDDEEEEEEEEPNPDLLAYVDDDLYCYIEDAIAIYAETNPEPIPYRHNPKIKR